MGRKTWSGRISDRQNEIYAKNWFSYILLILVQNQHVPFFDGSRRAPLSNIKKNTKMKKLKLSQNFDLRRICFLVLKINVNCFFNCYVPFSKKEIADFANLQQTIISHRVCRKALNSFLKNGENEQQSITY